jgi:large repetitive protein
VTRSGGDTEVPHLVNSQVDCSSLDITAQNECLSAASLWDATQLYNAVRALYTDNCDNSLTVTLTNTAGGTNSDCSWSFTYTYKIEDDCNNSVTCTVTRSGGDTEVPHLVNSQVDCSSLDITLQNECLSAATAWDATQLYNSVRALYTDNCDNSLTVTLTNTLAGANNTDCNWIFTYTYKIEDNCNNSVTCTVTRSGSDQTNPTPVTQNITIYLDAQGQASIAEDAVNNQSYDDCQGQLTFDTDITSFDCSDVGNNTVTLTVYDACLNSASATATVTVVDNTLPTITCVGNQTRNTNNGLCNYTTVGAEFDPTVWDNCGYTVVNNYNNTSTLAGAVFNKGLTTVVWTITDASSNSATCSFTLTVVDNQAPNAICKTATISLNANGIAVLSPSLINNGSTDNCAVTGVAAIPNTFDCSDLGFNTVMLMVFDQAGNVGTCNTVVLVQDIIPPTPICKNITVQLDQQGFVGITGAMVDNGSYDNCSVTSLAVSPNNFTCANTGANTVILTVTDQSGNTATCIAIVTVVDNILPTISCVGNQNRNTDPAVCTYTAVGTEFDPTYGDNCPNPVITWTAIGATPAAGTGSMAGTVFPKGTTTVVMTVTDASNNTATCSFTVTVNDAEAPVISLISTGGSMVCFNAAVFDGWMSTFGTALDNCDGVVPVTYSYTAPVSNCNQTIIVTFTATDASNNVATATASFDINDQTGPTIFLPYQTLSMECFDASLVDQWAATATAWDNCSMGTPVVASYTAPSSNCNQIVTVTFTSVDPCNNVSTATATFTVDDNTPPLFAAIQPFTSSCSSVSLQNDLGLWLASVNASDNCGQVTITNDFANLTLPASGCGTITVTFTATDQCQNVSTATSTITLTDTQAPVFAQIQPFTSSCSSVSLQNDLGLWLASVNASDNCGQVTITNDFANLTLPATGCGTITVTFTATDQCQNVSTATSTITLTDTQAPVFATIQPFTASCSSVSLQNDLGLWLASVNATDNCGQVSISNDFANLTLPVTGCGTITVTFTATDQCQNISTATSTITLTDTQAPVFATIQPFTASCSSVSLQNDLGLWLASVSATDNCGQVTVTNNYATLTLPATGCGTITVTFTAIDQCQNVSTATSTITLTDTQAPVFATIQPFTASCSSVSLQNDLGLWLASVSATDNCGQVTLTNNYATLTLPATGCGTITVTFTATDQCQNVSTATSTITLTDTQAPVFAQIQPFTSSCSSTSLQNNIGLWLASVSATDNCGQVTVTNNYSSLTLPATGCGTITVTFTAIDQCQNISTATSTITLTDTQAPVFATIQPFTASCSSVSLQNDLGLWLASVSATDNCGQVTVTNDFASLTLPATGCGTITVTFTATDQCQNVSTAISTITLTDTQSPVFATIQPFTASCSSVSMQNDLGMWLASVSATDNCGQVTVTNDFASLTLPASGCGTITVTFTAIDQCQNISTATSTITLTDTQAPVFAQIQPFTASCSSVSLQNDLGLWLASVSATDNCGQVTVTNNYSTLTLPANGCGTITVIFTATDQCNNVTTASSTITLTDNVAPVFAAITPFTSLCSSTSLSNNIGAWLAGVSATDNCGQVTVTNNFSTLTLPASGCGTITVIFTATDQCNNVTTTSSTITLTDNMAPVFAQIQPFTASCSSVSLQNDLGMWLASVSATDNCGQVTVTNNYSTLTLPANGCGTITVIFTATDQCQNISTATSTITLTDTQAPVLACPTSPQSRTIFFPVVTYTTVGSEFNPLAVSDNCGAVSLSNNINNQASLAGHVFPVGQTTVIWTAVDQCNNISTCTVVVNVIQGNMPPVISCPANITLNANSTSCNAQVTSGLAPTYSDPDNNIVSVTWMMFGATAGASPSTGINVLSSYTFNPGTTNILYTVKDAAGLSAACFFTVKVLDVTPPTIVCPGNQILTLNYNCKATIPNYIPSAMASDNCSGVTIYQTPSSGPITTGPGTFTVVLTAVDAAGNSTTCSFTVTKVDVTPPVITACPPNQSINLNAGCQITVPNLTANMNGSDNCGTVSFTQVPAAGTMLASGHNQTHTVVITASDGNGNSTQCLVVLTSKDVTAPNLQVAGNVTLGTSADGSGNCDVLYAVPDAVMADNCSNLLLSWQISGALTQSGLGQVGSRVFPTGQSTIVYTLTDGAFTVNSSMTVTVVDDEAPVVTLLGNASETLCVGAIYTDAGATASDNCGGNLGAIQAQGTVNTAVPGVYILTYIALDAAGNSSTPVIRTVNVITCGVSVSGTYRYFNQAQTALANITVDLMQNNQVLFSAVTNAAGQYSFPLVQPGTYEVLAGSQMSTAGAINALDAGMVNAWGVTPYTIEKVRFRAADVLYDDYLDAGDAVRINAYYIQQGNPPWAQPLTKWSFWRSNESISYNPFTESFYPTITVAGSPVVQDFFGLVTGDFNGSFVPGPAKSSGSIQLNNGQKMPVAPGSLIDLPVKVEQAMTVGAISLTATYPADRAEVMGVYLYGNSNISIPYVAANGTLRIGWFGNAGSLATGQVLFSIRLKLADDLNTGDLVRIVAAEDPLNELGNAALNVIGNAGLSVPELQVTTTGFDGSGDELSVDVSCYPNPFRGSATIEYSLPVDGRVLVEVYDLLGQRLYLLNDTEMPAGTHRLDFDAGSWSTGVYLLRVEVQSDDGVLVKSIRISNTH